MKKTNTNRIISSIIIAMMVVTSLIIPVSADENEMPEMPIETLPVYQSSVGFSTTSADGTWGDGVWSAEILDKTTGVYTPVTTADTNNEWNAEASFISGTRLVPYVGTKANMQVNLHKVAVKTFTAPVSGTINISYADVADGYTGLCKTQGNTNLIYRITKQIANGSKGNLLSDVDYYTAADLELDDAAATVSSITVFAGDKIHFEAERVIGSEGSDYHGLYCDPIITYTELIDYTAPANRNAAFKASEYFDLTSGGAWDSGVWQAMYYDHNDTTATTEKAKYKVMPYVKGNNYTSAWGNASNWNWGDRGALIGTEYMRPEVYTEAYTGSDPNSGAATDAEKESYYDSKWNHQFVTIVIGRDYPVKAFVAPKDGSVKISAAKFSKGHEGYPVNVKISKLTSTSDTPLLIWPGNTVHTCEASNELSFTSIYADLKTGDMLLFEVPYIYLAGSGDATESDVNWDPVVEYTSPSVADRTAYKSSDNFGISNGNGTWDSGVWTAEILDTTTGEYTPVTTANKDCNYNVYGATVTPTTIIPPAGAAASLDLTKVAVKTFTAPKSGMISISYADVADSGVTGLGRTQGNTDTIYRVTKQISNGTKVNLVGDLDFYTGNQNTAAYKELDDTMATVSSIFVSAGDKIRFEVARYLEASTSSDYHGLYCDPVITYTAVMTAPETRNEFRSAEFYDTNGETAKWDNGVWQAWFYDWDDSTAENERAKYKLMVATKDNATHGTCFISNPGTVDYSWGNKAAYIGETYMIADTTSGLTQAEWQNIGRDYPVKVFTAPKSGVVTIDAALLAAVDGKNSTTGADNIDYFNIRIKKLNAETGEPVQIFPASGYFTKYGKLDQICEADFPAMQTYLAEGDMLLFEDVFRPSTLEGANGYSAYASALNWDPTVEYTTGTVIDKANIVFKSGEDIVTGVVNIATAANLTATIPVYSGTAFEKAIVVVGIYDSNDMLVRVGMSEDISISATEPNNVPVTFGAAASEIESGSIKVFLWEGLSSLAPVAAAMPIQ